MLRRHSEAPFPHEWTFDGGNDFNQLKEQEVHLSSLVREEFISGVGW